MEEECETGAIEFCERCQNNGEIITDWDLYLRPPEGAPPEAGTADCPDCVGGAMLTAR